MATGFTYQGKDLDDLCEPKRSGITSAQFGGEPNKFVSGTDDLYDRYASYPTGYGYATKAEGVEETFKHNGLVFTAPSAIGCRPVSDTSYITLNTSGTFYVWRNPIDKTIKIANASGSVTTSLKASTFGLNEPPRKMMVRIVGGGGAGGKGTGTIFGNPAGGGGGAGGCIIWLDIPTTTIHTEGLQCIVAKGGTPGSSNGDPGGGGGETKIVRAGATLVSAKGGGGGKNKRDGGSGAGPAGSCSVGSSYIGSFHTTSGGIGGNHGRVAGGSITVPNHAISPEITISKWTHSGGPAPGNGGGGGASILGSGGRGGGDGSSSNAGSGYGAGGGGGTYNKNLGGSAGSGGAIIFYY